jgi:photosystem II stability/assembly factor-like uncharacterized protein
MAMAQSGWIPLNLIPGTNYDQLSAVCSTSPSTCLVFDEYDESYFQMSDFKVFRTTNFGISWELIGFYENRGRIYDAEFVDENTGFAGGGWSYTNMGDPDSGFLLFKTTNGGNNWTYVYGFGGVPFMDQWITDISVLNSQRLIACRRIGSIVRSTNGGANFSEIYFPPPYYKNGIEFIDSLNAVTVGDYGYISYTSNGGNNWFTPERFFFGNLKSVDFTDGQTGWIVGDSGTILKTTNGGANWILQNSNPAFYFNKVSFHNSDTGWAVGRNVILATSNGGINWINQSTLYNGNFLSVSFTDSRNGYVCAERSVLGSSTGGWVGAVQSNEEIVHHFELMQNYPNPFNPSTTIDYILTADGKVLLTVFDVSGRKIADLVDSYQLKGKHSYKFNLLHNGYDLSSGTYFYRLQSNNSVQTRSMLLLK